MISAAKSCYETKLNVEKTKMCDLKLPFTSLLVVIVLQVTSVHAYVCQKDSSEQLSLADVIYLSTVGDIIVPCGGQVPEDPEEEAASWPSQCNKASYQNIGGITSPLPIGPGRLPRDILATINRLTRNGGLQQWLDSGVDLGGETYCSNGTGPAAPKFKQDMEELRKSALKTARSLAKKGCFESLDSGIRCSRTAPNADRNCREPGFTGGCELEVGNKRVDDDRARDSKGDPNKFGGLSEDPCRKYALLDYEMIPDPSDPNQSIQNFYARCVYTCTAQVCCKGIASCSHCEEEGGGNG